MINLNLLRSVKTLESMKKDLEFFIKEPIIKEIYDKDYDWDENDYEADREEAAYLIEMINLRIKSLSKIKTLNPPKEKQGKQHCKKSDESKTACEEQAFPACVHDSYTSPDNNPSEASQSQ